MQESEGVLCMRVSFRIALAGQVIGVSALYEQTRTFCKNYLTDAPASFEVAVTPADSAFEREKKRPGSCGGRTRAGELLR